MTDGADPVGIPVEPADDSFSSPYIDLRQSTQPLTDNIVLAASWVMGPGRTS